MSTPAGRAKAEGRGVIARLKEVAGMFDALGLEESTNIFHRAVAVIENLIGYVDIFISEPMTIQEAEHALGNLPELDEADRAALDRIDVKKILAYATDPMNASGECMVRKLVEALQVTDYRSLELRVAQDEAEAWLEKRSL